MKIGLLFSICCIAVLSCGPADQSTPPASIKNPIEGTWKLISGITIVKTDSTFTDYTKTLEMIKMINSTHFAFLKHDLDHGKDSSSAVFDAGGGRYTLTDDQYTERLEYCNARAWEAHDFTFTVSVKGDTLTQQGIEKVEGSGPDRMIIEKYFRQSK